MIRTGTILAAALACCLPAVAARADLVSEDSAFGPDTVTLDTQTGARWLDLLETTSLTFAQIHAETGTGGAFEGWQLASRAEIATLFEHAGLDLASDDFVPENHDPATALAALLGTTGTNGNCGSGCEFSFAQGRRLRAPGEEADRYWVASFAWFDNSAPLNPSYPQAPIGRALLDSYNNNDFGSAALGAWLVQAPEPGPGAGAAAGLASLAALARGRRSR